MAIELQLRKGTTTEHSTFTGANAEVTVDTSKDTVVVHDGSTAGGHPLAKASDVYTKTEINNKPTGFKNYIINGGFDVWQRGTTQSVSGYGSADRFNLQLSGATGSMTRIINSTALNNVTGKYRCRVRTTVADDASGIVHYIEGLEKFNSKTVTLSFRVYVADGLVSNRVTLYERFDSAETDISHQFNFDFVSGWQTIERTFTLSNNTGKTFGDNSSLQIEIKTVSSKTIDWQFDYMQLEEGSVATPFEQRPYGLEFDLCQRYYQSHRLRLLGYGSVELLSSVVFPQLRTAPTLSQSTATDIVNTSATEFSTSMGETLSSMYYYILASSPGRCGLSAIVYLDAEL